MRMPAISRFRGIVVSMHYGDHPPAHFHVCYGEHRATVTIESLQILAGGLPRRVRRLVVEWALARRPQLRDNWDRALSLRPLLEIEPLP